MIITITLNPAVDKTVEIDDFKTGTVNRISSLRVDAGGKGINVSKVIKSLNEESTALGFLAGRNGEFIEDYLSSINIDNKFLFIQGETRTNIKVVDKINSSNTDINEPGNFVSAVDLNKLEENIFKEIDKDSIIVFSGSVPAGVSNKVYGMWIKKAKALGAKTILDADGELLKEGIKEGPYLVKPNIHELERLLDVKLDSLEATVNAGKRLLEFGIEKVVISLGKDGALFIDKNNVVQAHGMCVAVNSTVGAGDSMVAALAVAIEKEYSLEDTVILAVATSAANVTTSGTQAANLNEILNLKKHVKFDYIK